MTEKKHFKISRIVKKKKIINCILAKKNVRENPDKLFSLE